MIGILCLSFTNPWPYRRVKRYLSISGRYIHHRKLWIWETYSWDISNGTSVEQTKYFRYRNIFHWFKYKRCWQWYSYKRLRQTRWLRFPIVNFPWLSGDIPWLQCKGVYISQLVRFARCCTTVLDFHSNNLKITSKLLTKGYKYHKLASKNIGKSFRSNSEFLSKFGKISFQEYVFDGISHPVFYGDLVYKLRRVKCEANFVLSGSKIAKSLRRRKYDPMIIKRTIDRVLGPSTALYRSFLKHCTLTNKTVGTIWREISKLQQGIQGPGPRSLWLLVGTPLVFGPELASTWADHSLLWWMSLYIFDILLSHLTCLCNKFLICLWPFRFGL